MKKKKLKTLIVVESPKKIKLVSDYLGPDYVVRASYGHVLDLKKGSKHHKLGIDFENDYKPKYQILVDKKDKIQMILNSTNDVDQIYLATDPDREGEAIAWHLAYCLESTGLTVKRILFHEITKAAIKKAVANPQELNKDLYDAQQARRVLDRIVGFLGSEFLRSSLNENLSAGRVQSVATRLIVDRELEIEKFIPEEYWNISACLSKSANDDAFIAKHDKIKLKTKAFQIKSDLDNDSYVVEIVDKKEKKRNPLPPLTTSTLQQAGSARFGFSVSKTMSHAQSLYEAGLITYMRTDSTRLSADAITMARDYLDKHQLGKPPAPNLYSTKGSAQDAHEAIRPTDADKHPLNVFLDTEQQNLYQLIWERYIASQMEPATYDTVAVQIRSSSNHILKANGRTLTYEGWLKIAKDQNTKDEEMLPDLNVGDNLILVDPKVKADQKFTQPSPRYGEASLVKELEKRGIGRPSTYAAIIQTIKGRNYVELKGKMYHATDVGKKVIDTLTNSFSFMDFDYTSNMELKLDQIADGNLDYVTMIDDFFKPFQEECRKAELSLSKDYGIVCELCGKNTILKHGPYGFYMKCIDAPDCKGTISVDLVDEKPIIKPAFQNKLEMSVACPKCNTQGMFLNESGRFGPYYYCQNHPRCKGNRKVPYGKKCNLCNNEMFLTIFNNERKLACMGYFESNKCRNIIDVPNDTSWIDPSQYKEQKPKPLVNKVLKARKTK